MTNPGLLDETPMPYGAHSRKWEEAEPGGGCEVVKDAAASRLRSRRKMARMRMATARRANRELHNWTNQCRCHEPARGHFWDLVTLRCANGSCTRTWEGQQVSPTDCEHRRSTPWGNTSDASSTVSVRDVGPRERRRVRGEV